MSTQSLPRLRINALEIKNYRCLKDVSLSFNDPITVLIGKNAAGKSTILDIFEFISEAIRDVKAALKKRGETLHDIAWGGQEGLDIVLRFVFDVPDDLRSKILKDLGEPTSLVKKATQAVQAEEIQPKVTASQLEKSHFLRQLIYKINFGTSFQETISCSGFAKSSSTQTLLVWTGPGRIFVRMAVDPKIWQLANEITTNFLLGESVNTANVQADYIPNLFGPLPQASESVTIVRIVCDLLRSYFVAVYHGSPYRKPMLSLVVSDNKAIDAEGGNLVQVLHTLHNNDRRTFQKIEADLRSLVDEIEFIGTPIVEKNKTTIDFHQELQNVGDKAFDLKQMSAGTAQLLILLTQIHASPLNSLILLEEIESMLHPSAQAQLMKILYSVTNEKTVILSTHSPVIASQAKRDSLILLKKRQGITAVHHYSDALAEEIVNEMGIRPSFSFESDIVIFVEGDFDEAVYRNWLIKSGWPQFSAKGMLIDAQGYTKIQFFVNAQLLSRKVLTVEVYAIFDGDTREKGDYKQAVRRLNLEPDHILELKARNLESLLANGTAIKAAFPTLHATSAEISDELAGVKDSEDLLKGALRRILRPVGGYTAESAVAISGHLNPPDEWLAFFRRLADG